MVGGTSSTASRPSAPVCSPPFGWPSAVSGGALVGGSVVGALVGGLVVGGAVGGGVVVGGGVAAVLGGVGAGVGFTGGSGGLSAVVGVGVPPVGTVSRPGGGSTSCCASSTAAWTASRVPPVRLIDPFWAATRTSLDHPAAVGPDLGQPGRHGGHGRAVLGRLGHRDLGGHDRLLEGLEGVGQLVEHPEADQALDLVQALPGDPGPLVGLAAGRPLHRGDADLLDGQLERVHGLAGQGRGRGDGRRGQDEGGGQGDRDHPAAHVPAAHRLAHRQLDDRARALQDPLQVAVGHPRVQLVGGQLGPEAVGRLHQRGKLVRELDRTPVEQGVELIVQLVWLGRMHPHRSSSS